MVIRTTAAAGRFPRRSASIVASSAGSAWPRNARMARSTLTRTSSIPFRRRGHQRLLEPVGVEELAGSRLAPRRRRPCTGTAGRRAQPPRCAHRILGRAGGRQAGPSSRAARFRRRPAAGTAGCVPRSRTAVRARRVEQPDKQGDVDLRRRVGSDITVDAVGQLREVGFQLQASLAAWPGCSPSAAPRRRPCPTRRRRAPRSGRPPAGSS